MKTKLEKIKHIEKVSFSVDLENTDEVECFRLLLGCAENFLLYDHLENSLANKDIISMIEKFKSIISDEGKK